jgi:hypothetical protein
MKTWKKRKKTVHSTGPDGVGAEAGTWRHARSRDLPRDPEVLQVVAKHDGVFGADKFLKFLQYALRALKALR